MPPVVSFIAQRLFEKNSANWLAGSCDLMPLVFFFGVHENKSETISKNEYEFQKRVKTCNPNLESNLMDTYSEQYYSACEVYCSLF